MEGLGRFRLLELVGKGGMGEVFRARDGSSDEVVALKVVRSDRKSELTILKRFQREFQAMAAVRHPNVIRLFEIGEDGGDAYFTMEYVDGRSLEAVLTERPYEARPGVDVGIQLCKGLAAVHDGGMCHRDVTPSNVMVTVDGTVKLMDFGLVKPLEQTATELTKTGTVVGTFVYLPPEVLRGKPADYRSDVYQAGVTLYQALTGTPPYAPEDILTMARGRPLDPPPALHLVCRGADPHLSGIVAKAMAFEPRHRYQRAVDFATALDRWLKGLPRTSSAAIEPYRPTSAGRRSWRPLLGLVPLVLVIAIILRHLGGGATPDYRVDGPTVEARGTRAVVLSWKASWRDERPTVVVTDTGGAEVTTAATGRSTVAVDGERFVHRLTLTRLAAGTRYHVAVQKPDGTRTLARSFETLAATAFDCEPAVALDERGRLVVTVAGSVPFAVELDPAPLLLDPRPAGHGVVVDRRWSATYGLAGVVDGTLTWRCTSIDGDRRDVRLSAPAALGRALDEVWQAFLDERASGAFHGCFAGDGGRRNSLMHELAVQFARAASVDERNRVRDDAWRRMTERLTERSRWYRRLVEVLPGMAEVGRHETLYAAVRDRWQRALLPLDLVDGAARWFGLPHHPAWQEFLALDRRPYPMAAGPAPRSPGAVAVDLVWQTTDRLPWTVLVDPRHPTAGTFVPPSGRAWLEPQHFRGDLAGPAVEGCHRCELEVRLRAVYSGMVPVVAFDADRLVALPPRDDDAAALDEHLQRTGGHTKLGMLMLDDAFGDPARRGETLPAMDSLMLPNEVIYRHAVPRDWLRPGTLEVTLSLYTGPVEECRPVSVTGMRLHLYP